MASVPVLNTIMVEMRGSAAGEQVENTLYFNKGGTWSPTEVVALGQSMNTWWHDKMQANLNTGYGLMEIQLTDLSSATGIAVTETAGLPDFGLEGGGMAANSIAPCISFHTAMRGRSFRGRNYICGITAGNVIGSNIDGDWMLQMIDAYNELQVVASTNLCEWVVVSRYSGMAGTPRRPVPRATGLSTPIISVSFTDNVVDSQRKRLPNH